VQLRVAPGSRQALVVGRHGDAWKVRVRAVPEGGRANAEVVSVVAAALGLPLAAVRLAAGASSRDKVVEVSGLDGAEIEQRLESAGRAAA
jgi:hypothetical protein